LINDLSFVYGMQVPLSDNSNLTLLCLTWTQHHLAACLDFFFIMFLAVFLNPARLSTRLKARVTGFDRVSPNFFYKSRRRRFGKKLKKNQQAATGF